jgi:hypothetical protein
MIFASRVTGPPGEFSGAQPLAALAAADAPEAG